MDEASLLTKLLPYPLPPWRHRFRSLSVFCPVDERVVRDMLPPELELMSNVAQFAVMFFDCTVPTRAYYDSAAIVQVRHRGVVGGYWIYGYTSTDEVLSGTRELWGYRMKLAEQMKLEQKGAELHGMTARLGHELIAIRFRETGRAFDPPQMFPRIFYKLIPRADGKGAAVRRVVVMRAETAVARTAWGEGELRIGGSAADPIHTLKPGVPMGAMLVEGDQVLVAGEELS